MKGDSGKYNIDKTAFSGMKAEEADNHYAYWKNKSFRQRLEAGCYLINQMYGTTAQTPLDKGVFSKRRHKHG